MGGKHVQDDCCAKSESQMTQISCVYNLKSIEDDRPRVRVMSDLQNSNNQSDIWVEMIDFRYIFSYV